MKLAVLDDGCVRSRSPLDDLRRAWSQATEADRRRFLGEIAPTLSGDMALPGVSDGRPRRQ
jgi:hypothetical protein